MSTPFSLDFHISYTENPQTKSYFVDKNKLIHRVINKCSGKLRLKLNFSLSKLDFSFFLLNKKGTFIIFLHFLSFSFILELSPISPEISLGVIILLIIPPIKKKSNRPLDFFFIARNAPLFQLSAVVVLTLPDRNRRSHNNLDGKGHALPKVLRNA